MLYNPQIETFIIVVDTGSFSKAARALYISPQAVIKQINQLEATVGLTLFVRTPQGVHVTPEGRSLYKDAQYIMQFSKDALLRAEQAGNEEGRFLRVGTSILTPDRYITERWPEISAVLSELQLRIVSFENSAESAREILANFGQYIDMVAGVYSDDFLERTQCNATYLKDVPFIIGCSVTNPLATKELLSWDDLESNILWTIRRGWSSVIDGVLDDIEQHQPYVIIKEFDVLDMNIFNHIANSQDLILTVEQWSQAHPLLRAVPMDWDYTIPFGILHAIAPSETVQHVLDILAPKGE